MSFRITVKGLEHATAELKAAVRAGLRNGLELAGLRGEQLVRENIRSPYNGHPMRVNIGILDVAITSRVDDAAGLIGRAVVFAQPPADIYAGVMELGRRPGAKFPPVQAMLFWVKTQLGIEDEKQAKSIAYLVGRKIHLKGIKGHFMFKRAFATLQTELRGIFESSVGRVLEAAGYGKK